MDRDSITRTGARAPGVERQDRSHGGAGKRNDPRHSAGASRWQQKARRGMANQRGLGRPHLIFRPWSRNGENPPYGILGRAMETAASFEARKAPLPYPTGARTQQILASVLRTCWQQGKDAFMSCVGLLRAPRAVILDI